jgi:hypothetical protein
MKQNNSSTWLAWDISIIAIALGLCACGRMLAKDAYTAFQIMQVQVLSTSDCSLPGEPSELHRTSGVLDLALPDGSSPPYYLPVVVANNMESLGGSPAEEMNNMTLQHFTVELSASNVTWSSSCPQEFDTQGISDNIGPGSTVGASLVVLTPSHSACLLPQVPPEGLVVTAKITAKGRHGGTTIESAPYIFPIAVCLGCLQTDYSDPALVAYRYPADYPLCAALTGTNPYTGDPCLPPGQDATILCCGVTTTTGGVSGVTPICPGVFTGTASTATSTSTAL